MPMDLQKLRSQRLRTVNHQGDALRLGMNWTEEDLAKPRRYWLIAPMAWANRAHSTSSLSLKRSATVGLRLVGSLATSMGDEEALNFAVAASALKHAIPGALNLVTLAEVQHLMSGDASGGVQR